MSSTTAPARVSTTSNLGWVVLAFVWLATCVGAAGLLWRYKMTPGESGVAPAVWPETSTLERPFGRPRLVMSVHPKCPCSRASLDELARLAANTGSRVQIVILAVKPAGADKGWDTTGLVEQARRLQGAEVLIDVSGAEAARLGAKTSGHVVAYGADGRLRFSGGLTPSRGHEGEAPRRALMASLALGDAVAARAPVYGCSLETK